VSTGLEALMSSSSSPMPVPKPCCPPARCHHETASPLVCHKQEPFSRIRKDLLREVKALKPGDRWACVTRACATRCA
jgi:hypothetical protein